MDAGKGGERLDFEEDMAFQAREWRWQRIGWGSLGVIVLLAMAGLLGSGPASRSKVEKTYLRIDYDRFAHRETTTPLDITYRHKQGDTSLVLEFDRSCLQGLEMEGTRPEPKATMAREGEGISLEFDLAPGAEWTKLHFRLKPDKAGLRRCRVRSDAGMEYLEFSQLVYP